MKINHILIAIAFLVSLWSCEKKPTAAKFSMNAEPESIFPGDTTALSFEISYINGLSFHAEWSCSFGVLFNPDEPVEASFQWIAPSEPGEYYITLTINDEINVTKDSLIVTVLDSTGSFIDPRDQYEYKWVKIGQQIWMTENLAYLPQISPHREGSSSEPFYYVYSYSGSSLSGALESEYYKTYGVLYNWPAANISCPKGWHLPSDEEYKILERYLGMSEADSDSNKWNRGPGVDDKMKSVNGWSEPDSATNVSGFNLAPAGMVRYERSFYTHGAGLLSELWCSSSDEDLIVQQT